MFHPVLGQIMQGSQLSAIPPNADPQKQIDVLNQIVGVLNNFSRDIVLSGTTPIPITGAAQDLTIIAHNLGYRPRAVAYLNDVTITLDPTDPNQIYRHVDIPLPTFLSSGTIGVGGGGGVSIVGFNQWMYTFVDSNNLYIHTLNPNATFIITFNVTWYLYRNPSN